MARIFITKGVTIGSRWEKGLNRGVLLSQLSRMESNGSPAVIGVCCGRAAIEVQDRCAERPYFLACNSNVTRSPSDFPPGL